MDKGIFRCFAKVKIIELGNDILMKSTGFKENHKVLVEVSRRLLRDILFRKVNKKDALQVCQQGFTRG